MVSIRRIIPLCALALFCACDPNGASSGGQKPLSTTQPDIGIFPSAVLSFAISVEASQFRRFLPIGLQMSVTNTTASTYQVPLLLVSAGFVKISLKLPSGVMVFPMGQGGVSWAGKLNRDLAPGESMNEAFTLQMGPKGDYLFREAGTYVVSVQFRMGLTAVTSFDIVPNTDASDLVAEKLLDDDEVRYLFSLEGGFHLKKAIAILGNVAALSPPSQAYRGYANYALGLAYAQAGAKLCGGPMALPMNIHAGETFLTNAFADLPTNYLKKRAAYLLARCYKTKGDAANYSKYKALYSSISHSFPSDEASLMK